MAMELGVSHVTYGRWEKSEDHAIRSDFLERIEKMVMSGPQAFSGQSSNIVFPHTSELFIRSADADPQPRTDEVSDLGELQASLENIRETAQDTSIDEVQRLRVVANRLSDVIAVIKILDRNGSWQPKG